MTLTIRRSIPSGWWFTLRRKGHTTYAWEVTTIAQGFHAVALRFWKENRPWTCAANSCPPGSAANDCLSTKSQFPILCDYCRGRFNNQPAYVRAWGYLTRRNS